MDTALDTVDLDTSASVGNLLVTSPLVTDTRTQKNPAHGRAGVVAWQRGWRFTTPLPLSLKWRGFVSLVQRLPLLAPLASAGAMLG